MNYRESRKGRENIYIYIRWFITNLQETPWVDAKKNKVLLVSSADRPCWCGRNIVWNMERDQSFWITSSEHHGTMPKRIFSFSCSMPSSLAKGYDSGPPSLHFSSGEKGDPNRNPWLAKMAQCRSSSLQISNSI
jgi:hypothetical protein